ncbi:TFP11-domain-containing protein [Xylariaceae sp. FL0594]|nr:TFP11-domain-containing protein [Xylariaceae sp. FL0594]
MSFNPAYISKADAAAYSSSDDDDESDNDAFAQPSVDPRADEFLDFNPRKRRKTGRNTKESAALGIFGSESEDDGAPSKRWKSKKDLRHKNVTFVSAGQQNLDQNVEEQDGSEEEKEEEEEDDQFRPGLGAKKFGQARGDQEMEDRDEEDDDEDEDMGGVGLGFRPSMQSTTMSDTPSKPPTMMMKTKYDGSNPLGKSFVPTSAKDPVLNPNVANKPASGPSTPKPSAFGAGSKAKSFAARMMAKMGYVEGKGLGADGQGRSSIIEATLRPQGNVGLGTVKEKSLSERKEEKRQARLRGEDVSDSDEERKRAKRDRKKKAGDSGSGSGISTPKRSKPKYMTVSDIQRAAPGLQIPEAFAPILDMTGRDHKLLTSGSGLLTPTAGTELIEQTEARKLARRAQGDLAAFVEEWKTLEDRKAWVDMQTLQHQQAVEEAESDFLAMRTFSLVLDEICQAARDQQWDPIISGLERAEATTSHYSEELSGIAVASIHPFLASAIQGWKPLEDPNLGNFATDLVKIKRLLGVQTKVDNGGMVTKWGQDGPDPSDYYHTKSTTPYESMIYRLIFPRLTTTISQDWDVYDAAPLLAVFEKWEPLFPPFVRSQLLEQVARRLEDAIADWKPRKDRSTLPHLWLFPWLQHLPTHHLDPKGSGLVGRVRRKYRQVIDSWDYEGGVIPGLKHWREVFRPSKAEDQWRPLIMHHLLPSMARYLRAKFRVDPGDQEPYLKALQAVLKWVDVVSSSMVAEVMVAEVFPLWHDVLHQWLTSDEANYEEIGAWFEWWHGEVFPPEIAAHESVKAEFQRGTAMIEKALELGDEAKQHLPRPEKGPARQSKSHHRPKTEKQPKPTSTTTPVVGVVEPAAAAAAEKPATFRDELEAWCQENDLQFIPIRRANQEGKHYFRLTARMDGKGGVLAYFRGDGDVLVVESRKTNGEFRRNAPSEWGALLGPLYEEVDQVGRK